MDSLCLFIQDVDLRVEKEAPPIAPYKSESGAETNSPKGKNMEFIPT